MLAVVAVTLSDRDDADSLLAKPSASVLNARLKIAAASATPRSDKGKTGDFISSLKVLGTSKQAQLFDTSPQDLDGLSAQEKVRFLSSTADTSMRVILRSPTLILRFLRWSGAGSSALSTWLARCQLLCKMLTVLCLCSGLGGCVGENSVGGTRVCCVGTVCVGNRVCARACSPFHSTSFSHTFVCMERLVDGRMNLVCGGEYVYAWMCGY